MITASPSLLWTEECNNYLQELKAALMSALMLAFLRSAEPFLLDTDAINVGIGAVLFLKCATVRNVSLPTDGHPQ